MEGGAAGDAKKAANEVINSLQDLGNRVVDLPIDVAEDLYRTLVRTLDRVGDAAFGKKE